MALTGLFRPSASRAHLEGTYSLVVADAGLEPAFQGHEPCELTITPTCIIFWGASFALPTQPELHRGRQSIAVRAFCFKGMAYRERREPMRNMELSAGLEPAT